MITFHFIDGGTYTVDGNTVDTDEAGNLGVWKDDVKVAGVGVEVVKYWEKT